MNEDKLIKRKQRARRNGNVQQLALVVKDLGDMYFETGRLDEALQEYSEQLEACRALGDKINCAVAHRMIGEVYASLGDYEQALTYQKFYLEGAQEITNLLEEQRAFATLGRTYFCLAEELPDGSEKREEALTEAKKAYTTSIRLCNKLDNADIKLEEMMMMRARLLLNLGLVLEAQKESKQGIDLIENAAEICVKHKLYEDLHRTHIALGALYERQGNNELALKHFDIASNVDNLALKADAHLAKVELLLKIGEWSEARKILVPMYVTTDLPRNLQQQTEKLLRIAVTLCKTEESLKKECDVNVKQKLYETLGDTAVAAYSYDKAIEYYRKMLSYAEGGNKKQESAALISLARTLEDVKCYDEAIVLARRELELCSNPRDMCRSALFLADRLFAAKTSDFEIRKVYDLALSKAKKCNDASLEASVLKELVAYLEKSGELEEAREIKERLDLLAVVDSDSENSECPNIGADICLDELTDVEDEIKKRTGSGSKVTRRVKGGNVLKKNEKGETQLQVACINGNIGNVEKLLAAGHSVNVRDNCGWTPLHEAANHGYIEIAELLLKAGANVNDPGGTMCEGITPLHDAAICGNFSMMRLLMEHGANVSVKTKKGQTVLDYLETWRDGVDDLSAGAELEYNNLRERLTAIMPTGSRRRIKLSPSPNSWDGFIDEENKDERTRVKKVSAGEDYKRTIANLKNRSGTLTLPASGSSKTVAPLLDSEEILVDDWLEDDVDSSVKKKMTVADCLPATAKRKLVMSAEVGGKYTKRQRINSDESVSSDRLLDEDSCDSNSTEIVNIIFDRPKKSVINKRARQISLLTAGFSRDLISPTSSPNFLETADTVPKQTSFLESINLQVLVEKKIFHLKLRFSEQRKITVATVIDDVKKKFEEDTGCKIQIDLTTMNGDVLPAESTLDVTTTNENLLKLKSTVIEIHTPPIAERYETICKTHHANVRDVMIKCLKTCENTLTFRLKADEMLEEELMPLLKSLEYQKCLQVLYLSGGTLFRFGEILNDSLTQLLALQELYLQGCDINYDCLYQIEKLPLRLRVLDLSYNPLGSESERKLCELLSPLKYLQTLNLCSCELKDLRFGITSNVLVNLDVSWNTLGGEGIHHLLRPHMLNLNLTSTLNPERSPIVTELLSNSTFSLFTLECLELASCNVLDSDVTNILSRTPNLAKLVLNGNSSLSQLSIITILKHRPTLSYIDMSGCTEITEPPDFEVHVDDPEICTLIVSMIPEVQRFWLGLWQGKGVLNKLPHNVAIFKPDL